MTHYPRATAWILVARIAGSNHVASVGHSRLLPAVISVFGLGFCELFVGNQRSCRAGLPALVFERAKTRQALERGFHVIDRDQPRAFELARRVLVARAPQEVLVVEAKMRNLAGVIVDQPVAETIFVVYPPPRSGYDLARVCAGSRGIAPQATRPYSN